MGKNEVFEFRGCSELHYAEVTEDSVEAYNTGTVKLLAPVGEIGKTVSQSSKTIFYDDKPLIVISSEGADTVKFTVPALPLAILAEITGQAYDATTGALFGGGKKTKYFAVGYRLGGTDNEYRYVWRLKGLFNIPEETSKTISDGTDTNNQSIEFIGVATTHKFIKGGTEPASRKDVNADTRDGKADVSKWFEEVVTPDTLKAKA